MWPFWSYSKQRPKYVKLCRNAARLLFEETLLNKDLSRITKETKFCSLCNEGIVEDVAHFLFSCPVLERQRIVMFNRVEECMPARMKYEFNNMSCY